VLEISRHGTISKPAKPRRLHREATRRQVTGSHRQECTKPASQAERWEIRKNPQRTTEKMQEHFQNVLNCQEPTSNVDICWEYDTGQLPVVLEDITEKEVSVAVRQLKNGKSAGVDKIQAELLKTANSTIPHLTSVSLCNLVWQQEAVPVDWRRGIIIPLTKKDDLTDCNNWRGITLLSVTGKVFEKVLLNRIHNIVDQLLRQQQAGFRPGRSCIDQIFSLWQIIQKVSEGQKPVTVNLVDFRKAFDSISRPALWKILKWYGLPKKLVYVIQSLYTDCCSAVRIIDDISG